jgi:hypothetical protein
MDAVLNTLPESDATITVLAEMAALRWVCEGFAHANSEADSMATLTVVFSELRALCLTTAITHIACSTMWEQLEGSRPLGDWGCVIDVSACSWCSQLWACSALVALVATLQVQSLITLSLNSATA